MEAQPAAVGAGHLLGFPEEADKEEQNEVGIDLRLELQVARVVLGFDGPNAALELQSRMKSVIDLLDEGDELADISSLKPRRGSCRSSWSISHCE